MFWHHVALMVEQPQSGTRTERWVLASAKIRFSPQRACSRKHCRICFYSSTRGHGRGHCFPFCFSCAGGYARAGMSRVSSLIHRGCPRAAGAVGVASSPSWVHSDPFNPLFIRFLSSGGYVGKSKAYPPHTSASCAGCQFQSAVIKTQRCCRQQQQQQQQQCKLLAPCGLGWVSCVRPP